MLTDKEKQKMIDHRIKIYEAKIFELDMDKTAALANGEQAEADRIDKSIQGLEKAIDAVRELLTTK